MADLPGMRRFLLIPLALLGLATLGLASANALVTTRQANAAAVGTIWRLDSDLITVSRRATTRASTAR